MTPYFFWNKLSFEIQHFEAVKILAQYLLIKVNEENNQNGMKYRDLSKNFNLYMPKTPQKTEYLYIYKLSFTI